MGVNLVKTKALLSAITSFFFGLVAYFLLLYLKFDNALWISAFVALLYYLVLLFFLIIYGRFMDKKYAEFEKKITSPVFYKTNGNFNLGNGKVKNGNIYLWSFSSER